MHGLVKSIKTGAFELIDSGLIHILEQESTTLLFSNDISIMFEFEKDKKNPESSIKVQVGPSESNAIKFKLININESSYGTTDFFKFATLDEGGDVYISFRVNSLNDKKVRSLEYSIYKKDA